jgi:hypothetical protein
MRDETAAARKEDREPSGLLARFARETRGRLAAGELGA